MPWRYWLSWPLFLMCGGVGEKETNYKFMSIKLCRLASKINLRVEMVAQRDWKEL